MKEINKEYKEKENRELSFSELFAFRKRLKEILISSDLKELEAALAHDLRTLMNLDFVEISLLGANNERDQFFSKSIRESHTLYKDNLYKQEITSSFVHCGEIHYSVMGENNIEAMMSLLADLIAFDIQKSFHFSKNALELKKEEEEIGLLEAFIHEINNPLMALSLYAKKLEEKSLELKDNEIQMISRRVLNGAERAFQVSHSIRGMMQHYKPQNMKKLSLNKMLSDSIGFTKHLIEELNAKVDLVFDDNDFYLYANQEKIYHIFTNIISNACHFISKDDGLIQIEARNIKSNWVEIMIEDNGKGIPPQDLKKIFNPFFTTRKEDNGTGLGLAIVKRLVLDLNGEIRVESQPNQGTRFYIKLPLVSE